MPNSLFFRDTCSASCHRQAAATWFLITTSHYRIQPYWAIDTGSSMYQCLQGDLGVYPRCGWYHGQVITEGVLRDWRSADDCKAITEMCAQDLARKVECDLPGTCNVGCTKDAHTVSVSSSLQMLLSQPVLRECGMECCTSQTIWVLSTPVSTFCNRNCGKFWIRNKVMKVMSGVNVILAT